MQDAYRELRRSGRASAPAPGASVANFQEPPETCRVLIISTISAIYNYEFAIEKPAGKSKRKLFGQRRVGMGCKTL